MPYVGSDFLKAAKTKSVNMSFTALYSYVINTNYRSISGVMSLFISIVSLLILAIKWTSIAGNQKVALIIVGLLFTVFNPLILAFRTFKQLKLSPSYKKPLIYTFSDNGITVSQGEQSQDIAWDMICRIMLTNKMLAIYTGRMHAFVIPLSELGDDRGKIIASVVQFTAAYKPRISSSLKRFVSGKGI